MSVGAGGEPEPEGTQGGCWPEHCLIPSHCRLYMFYKVARFLNLNTNMFHPKHCP